MERIADLCRQHAYPKPLRDLLDALVDGARREIPDLRALVFSGSVATGDFVWRESGGTTRLLSDIDALAFSESGTPSSRFSTTVERLEKSEASHLFHIDVALSPISALRGLPNRYQFVEARLAGVAPVGPEVLASFPHHFDPRAARQSFFGNISKGVMAWVAPENTDDEAYRLCLARMILDLPLLAFAERGRCIPGHKARVEAFLELDEPHTLATAATRRAVELALRMRERGDVARSDLEAQALLSTDAVLNFLDGQGAAGPVDRALAQRVQRLLPPRTPRRLAGELRAALSDSGCWKRDPGWWLRRKESVGGAALIGLLRFALEGATGSPPAGLTEQLAAFTGGRAPTGDGRSYLSNARHLYWEGRCRLYPSEARSRSRFEDLEHYES